MFAPKTLDLIVSQHEARASEVDAGGGFTAAKGSQEGYVRLAQDGPSHSYAPKSSHLLFLRFQHSYSRITATAVARNSEKRPRSYK